MTHAQKPDFVFRRNGRGVPISNSNAGYTKFRGSVKGTGYTLHSPVSPSLPLPCAITFQLESTCEFLGLTAATALQDEMCNLTNKDDLQFKFIDQKH
jgi:hypothetical protein